MVNIMDTLVKVRVIVYKVLNHCIYDIKQDVLVSKQKTA